MKNVVLGLFAVSFVSSLSMAAPTRNTPVDPQKIEASLQAYSQKRSGEEWEKGQYGVCSSFYGIKGHDALNVIGDLTFTTNASFDCTDDDGFSQVVTERLVISCLDFTDLCRVNQQ